MLAIGVVCGAITAVVAVFIPWMPDASSEEARPIDNVYWLATIISIVIFALVAAVLVYSVIRFRAAPDDEEDGSPIHGNTRLEVVWTAVPTALVTAITVYSGVVLVQNEDKGPATRVVEVSAAQFSWSFGYPEAEATPPSGELVLPVGEQVQLRMTSHDVIHSFWVPQWRLKQDVVPGIETTLLITPDRLGTYDVICTELCGLGHSVMRTQARVVPRQEFDSWLRSRARAAAGGGADEAEQLFVSNCGSCHTLAEAGTSGEVGPNLDETLPDKEPTYVRVGIVDPNAELAPGYQPDVMPQNYGEIFTEQQIDGLVDYLVDATSEGG
jgi:cytochrome c oxidase subunit 2